MGIGGEIESHFMNNSNVTCFFKTPLILDLFTIHMDIKWMIPMVQDIWQSKILI